MKVATLYAICLFLSGACCAAMMLFSNNYYVLLTCCAAFGLFYACQHSLTPALVAILVPLDKFSMAYGLSLLCQGIGKLTGPPLAGKFCTCNFFVTCRFLYTFAMHFLGMLFDITQSYAQSFYQAAFWIVISGVLIGIIPYTKDKKLFAR